MGDFLRMKYLVFLIGMLLIIGGCSKANENNTTNSVKTQESKTELVTNDTTEVKESASEVEQTELWPEAFKVDSTINFSYPSTLSEAESFPKGIWWTKIKQGEPNDTDKELVQQTLWSIAESSLSDGEKGSQIKRFFAETYFPDLPGMSLFLPRGQIDLNDVESKSNIKLNGREMKEQINIAIILDASGSMKQVQGGKTIMEMAKESISDFTSGLPENAKVSLTVYGHKGTGSDQDKKLSCSSIEDIYPLSSYNQDSFESALKNIWPSGWTSMAESLKQTGAKLSQENDVTNVIYLVSDGKETCDGNPTEEAKNLVNSNINPIINVIGLSVSGEDEAQLKEIAESAEGRYIDAENQKDLDREFEQSRNTLNLWVDWYRQNNDKAVDQLSEDKQRLMDLNKETVDNLQTFKNISEKALIDLNHSGKINDSIYQDVYGALNDFYRRLYSEKDQLYNEKYKRIEDSFNLTKEEMDTKYNNK